MAGLDIEALLAAAADKWNKEVEKDKLEEEARARAEEQLKRKVKPKVKSEIAIKKETKKKEKIENKAESALSEDTKYFIDGLVADYITKVSPDIGAEFKNEHFLRYSDGHTLEEVVDHYKRTIQLKNSPADHSNKQVMRKIKSAETRNGAERYKCNKFSNSEDEYILSQLKAGVKLSQIARSLGRQVAAIFKRTQKLKRNGATHHRKLFSLVEDQIIIDNVVDALLKMKHKSIRQVSLQSKELVKTFNREFRSIRLRCDLLLLWIVSYYKGMLNLDIRCMLVNYLADNFHSRASIDWNKVQQVLEFSAHTPQSLKHEYEALELVVSRSTGVDWTEVTLQQVFEYVSSGQLKRKRNVSQKRQMVVIEYFEKQLEKNNIDVKDLDLS